MRRKFYPLALLFALVLASGCVSPRRLFSLTPLSGGDSRRTVNLWPLCYASGDGLSVGWPVYDTDANGFALRPLVFKEKQEWGVLWPVSDFDDHYFRLLNMIVSKDYGSGVIPLCWIYHGSDNDYFYQFLLAYKRDGENWGLFPIFHHGANGSYCFPLYYHNCYTKKLLTPISYFSPTFNYFTLAWWNRDNGSWGLFPLLGFGKERRHILLWWKTPNSNGLFPIYFNINNLTAVGPVWWNRDSCGLFPLFSYRSTATKKEVSLLCHILGGYDGRPADGVNGLRSYDWLCGFGKYEVSPYGQRGLCRYFRMWPLFNWRSTSDSFANNAGKSLRHSALLGLLWNYRSSSQGIWTGDMAEECEELSRRIVMARHFIDQKHSASDASAEDGDEVRRQFINRGCVQLDLEPLQQVTHESLDALAEKLERKYPRSILHDCGFGTLCDIIDYERTADTTKFKLLWGALFRHEASSTGSEDAFLWRVFRQAITPATTSREIFPFISYYHNKEDNTTVASFAWRLFRRETSPDGNKLWLFFIPFQ